MDLTKIEIDRETLYTLACRALDPQDGRHVADRKNEPSTVLSQKVDEAARKIVDASAVEGGIPVLVATWPPYKERRKKPE